MEPVFPHMERQGLTRKRPKGQQVQPQNLHIRISMDVR